MASGEAPDIVLFQQMFSNLQESRPGDRVSSGRHRASSNDAVLSAAVRQIAWQSKGEMPRRECFRRANRPYFSPARE